MKENSKFNILNQKFNNLTVIEFIGIVKGHRTWKCKCDCGKEKEVRAASLVNGNTKSCGCLQKEIVSKQFTTHGKTGSITYKSWQHMKDRCLNIKDQAYKDYGGRGITICDRWLESFENFIEDMGECPKGLTIDRIENDKGYYKDNCRWIDRKTQNNNKRNNYNVTYKGETKSLMLFCEELNLEYFKTLGRIKRHKWTIEDAFEIKDCKEREKPLREFPKINFNI